MSMNSLDERYDQMLHEEFAAVPCADAEPTPEPPRGLARYRSAALVGAGGLACAIVGALLGGLSGYFALSPAGAHPVTSSSQDLPLSSAVHSAYHAHGVTASAAPAAPAAGSVTNDASGAAAFSEAAGPLVHGLTNVTVPTADLPTTAPTSPGPSGGDGSGGSGSASAGTGGVGSTNPSQGNNGGSGSGGTIGQATGILELGLGNIMANLTGALDDLGTLSDDPTAMLTGLVPPLEGVVSDVTGTLMNLSSLMPLSGTRLPVGSLGTGGITSLGGGLPDGAPTLGGATIGATADKTQHGTPSPSVSALGPIVSSVAAAATGSKTPSIPSLPLPSAGSAPSVPSLPAQSPSGALPEPPTVSVPTVNSNTGSTTINVPVPSLPVSAPPVTIPLGPVNVGVNLGGSDSGATLSLP